MMVFQFAVFTRRYDLFGAVNRPFGILLLSMNSSTRMRVRFPKGTWNFRVSQLRPLRFQPGDYVQWKKHDEDIPEGDCRNPVGFNDFPMKYGCVLQIRTSTNPLNYK